jgi:hypothetical protein
LNENQPVAATVGGFATGDPEAGDAFGDSLVSGTGSTDNGSSQIVGGALQTNAVFNFKDKSSYSIREAKASYTICARARSGSPALSFDKSVHDHDQQHERAAGEYGSGRAGGERGHGAELHGERGLGRRSGRRQRCVSGAGEHHERDADRAVVHGRRRHRRHGDDLRPTGNFRRTAASRTAAFSITTTTWAIRAPGGALADTDGSDHRH